MDQIQLASLPPIYSTNSVKSIPVLAASNQITKPNNINPSPVTKTPTNDIESQPPSPSFAHEPPTNAVTAQTSQQDANTKWKTFAMNFALLLAGISDASTGALIPYLKIHYNIGLAFVALVYIVNFCGWLGAALTNVHITARLGMEGVMVIGGLCQLAAFVIMCTRPVYPLYVIAFFLSGIGIAYQDSQANTFVANLPRAHLHLGFLHAIYGVGALISPLIATAIANSSTSTNRWYFFYFIPVGLAVLDIIFCVWGFRNEFIEKLMNKISNRKDNAAFNIEQRRENRHAQNKKATSDLMKILRRKEVWIISAFFFLYVGTEVTAGGWVVEFLIEVRGGKPDQVGYIGSAFWGGLTLGRLLLAEPTNRYGERLMIIIYIVAALVVQFIFWFVPTIAVSGVMIGLLGFLIGPFFPVGISLATKLLPRDLHAGAIGFMSTTGISGSAAFPFLTGVIAASKGVKVLQPMLVGLLAAQGILWVLVPKVNRHTQ